MSSVGCASLTSFQYGFMLIYSYNRDTEVQSEGSKLYIMCFLTPKHIIKIVRFPDLINLLRCVRDINAPADEGGVKLAGS